jgi:hypothetical protein
LSWHVANGPRPRRGSGGVKVLGWANFGPVQQDYYANNKNKKNKKKIFRAEINIFSGLFFLDKLIMLIMFILGHNFNCHA